MVKRARPFSLCKMAQFGMIPPETGTNNTPLQRWSTRLGLENGATSQSSPAALSWQTWRLGTHPVQAGSAPFPRSLRLPPLATRSPRPTPDCQRHRYATTQLSSLILEASCRLKCCAIQQMNLLFGFLSLLSYGFQLNIIEAGSWFAVWAIWRRISFFVIMPRRRLERINGRSALIQAGKP